MPTTSTSYETGLQVTAQNTYSGGTGTARYYQFDAQGNTTHELSSTGSVVANHYFDAWGNLVAGDSLTSPFGYIGKAGYYTDTETGLILCTHRYYDSSLGRWVTRDPIGYKGGFNLYGYVGNDVVGKKDVEGLFISNCDETSKSHIGMALQVVCRKAQEIDACLTDNGCSNSSTAVRDLCNNKNLEINCACGASLPCSIAGACAYFSTPTKMYICPKYWDGEDNCPGLYCLIGHEFVHMVGSKIGHLASSCFDCIRRSFGT